MYKVLTSLEEHVRSYHGPCVIRKSLINDLVISLLILKNTVLHHPTPLPEGVPLLSYLFQLVPVLYH